MQSHRRARPGERGAAGVLQRLPKFVDRLAQGCAGVLFAELTPEQACEFLPRVLPGRGQREVGEDGPSLAVAQVDFAPGIGEVDAADDRDAQLRFRAASLAVVVGW